MGKAQFPSLMVNYSNHYFLPRIYPLVYVASAMKLKLPNNMNVNKFNTRKWLRDKVKMYFVFS